MYWGISPSFGGFHEHSLNCEPNGNSKLDAVKYRGLVCAGRGSHPCKRTFLLCTNRKFSFCGDTGRDYVSRLR